MKTNKTFRFLVATAAVATLTGTGMHFAEAGPPDDADPATHPVPVISFDRSSKSIVADLHMTGDGSATMTSAQVAYGRASSNVGNPPLLDVRIIDDQGAQSQQFDEWDPRWVESEDSTPGQFTTRVVSDATGTITFPFEPDVREMRVFNTDAGVPVGSYDLGPAILAFCTANPSDADCATDLSLTKSDGADPAVAGTNLDYTLTVRNLGPNPAQSARVVDTLPAGFTYVSGPAGCSAGSGTVTCELGYVASGATVNRTIRVAIPASYVYDAGAPVTVTNKATVTNVTGQDTTPGNNTDQEQTLVVAVADVSIDAADAAPPLEVLIGTPTSHTATVTVSNAGPSSPIDTVLSRTVTSTPGLTISPASRSIPVDALAVGAPRSVSDTYTVTCTTPGLKSVTMTWTLALKNAVDTDPDLSDNTASRTFSVDCVVPILINIRPGSTKNPIDLNTDAVLAALTTRAGEYGLPVAFDAATVEISTVRYGIRSILFGVPGVHGATEQHGKNHLERSYELDETTIDGDRDGVMHFKPDAGGLTASTTEACLKGRFSPAPGQTFTFFGCDKVTIVP